MPLIKNLFLIEYLLEKEKYVPKEKFVTMFNPEWDYFFQGYDNAIIKAF